MDFFEFSKPRLPTLLKTSNYQLNDSNLRNYTVSIPSTNTKPDIIFKPIEPNTLNSSVIFLDNSTSMNLLGDEPPDACKVYIQSLYDVAIAEPDEAIREKILNVNVRVILFNHEYTEIINDCVRNLNKPNFRYWPQGMTDLYSPVYDVMADSTPKNVVIISDGQNNSGPHHSNYMSRQFANAILAGWSIKFIGCTIDAITESNKLNLRDQTYDCSIDKEGSPTLCTLMRTISETDSQLNRERSI